jgi:hypothetical protein
MICRTIETISKYTDQFYSFDMDQDTAYRALRDSLSTGQMRSKLKLIEICKERQLISQKAVFIGHWHGLLPLLMYNEGVLKSAIGIEKSQLWSDFSNQLNQSWDWQSFCQDALLYTCDESTDLVVNTSCEHMSDDWLALVPSGCRVLLQSTNFEHIEHINYKLNIEEFKKSLKNINIVFEDILDCQVYQRFTIFGHRK